MGTHPIFESDFDCLTDFLKMQRDFRKDRNYDPNKLREPKIIGSCLWKPMSMRNEHDDAMIDAQQEKMANFLKQSNIKLCAAEDKNQILIKKRKKRKTHVG